ncbi:alpha-ketoglutarate-dependent dioxygenase AlkB [Arsenicitalea aurantiaca]|uniref:Alpha-ketoglutarate-dependent dioxygenase AlkB n=1 Tax=Arsenicitalea aurantiaca TaxID=1783274 RepID=A0A433X7Y1_9HYPH|nr:alpha-ketoglutarate-dependent dioxygenase AlkB [Arsenicitalea aurantiaca]RUT30174.1 alpha-ketoglutarate-dependent dioxygenase AlkB [Arsenicitalea aurantiaca]
MDPGKRGARHPIVTLSTPDSPLCDHLDQARQIALFDAIMEVLSRAPFFRPTMPRWGTPFSVQMSNCGPLGWVSDKSGYRYQPHHPVTGAPWPAMPEALLELWARHARYGAPPEACLINYYAPNAKMGLHQDRDEEDFDAPVLSISLGDGARFRLGGMARTDPAQTLTLASGDVMILAGPTRLAFHGIDKVYPGTSSLLSRRRDLFPEGGRLNLTLRRVNRILAP